jgi:NitT/TauT family transport system substrate-binding protein
VLEVARKSLVCICLALLTMTVRAESLPVVNASALQFGTVHWELAAMVEQGLDRAHGFELAIDTRANLSATRLALAANQADVIVGDWLWAAQRHVSGSPKLFMPYSASIGSLIVQDDSDIEAIADLAGRRIGVAGGPDSKGWILLQAVARKQGVELSLEQVQFAAPPLLNQALRRGQLDAVLTYWHYGAKLLAGGDFRELVSMTRLAKSLGLNAQMPMLGYVFNRSWAEAHPRLVDAFAAAIADTKARLISSDAAWEPLRTLMRADDDALFQAYKAGYRAGDPGPLRMTPAQIGSAQSLYRLIREQMPTPGGTPERLPADLFYQAQQ